MAEAGAASNNCTCQMYTPDAHSWVYIDRYIKLTSVQSLSQWINAVQTPV
jgi:hypothetical protein